MTETVQRVGRAYRVLMIAPTSFFADYGCHVRILEEAGVLGSLGHQVTIATYRNGGDVPGLDIRRTLPIPWRKDYEVGSSRHKVGFDALLGLKTAELLAAHRFDVIHAHLHEGALIGLALGRLFGVPVLFDFQGSMTGEMIDHGFLRAGGAPHRILRALETRIDRHAHTILTSSVHARRLLVDEFGCDPARIRDLPDAVNADVFKPASHYAPLQLANLRARLGIPSGRRIIAYLGLLAAYQGTGLLLEAMAHILSVRQDVHLLLMGFPNEDTYRQRAKQLGIDAFVTFTGRVPYFDAPQMLALGDVAVSAKLSLTEGAGKLLNYMAVGMPTVAFDTPVAREYLGADGRYAERGDAVSLGEELMACLDPRQDDASGPEQQGMRLRQRAVQQFGWSKAGQEIIATYDALVQRRPLSVPAARWSPDGK